MKLNDLLSEQLDRIRPSEEELSRLDRLSDDFIKKLNENGLEAFVGGSLAKGTVVTKMSSSEDDSGAPNDVDIFVVFGYSEEIPNLEKVLNKMKLGKKLSKVHGSRDYFQVDYGDVILEVIPVVRTEDPELAENVTDVSLSHVKYVRGALEKNPNLADEIRLAKSFARANRFYGAESYVNGFSGYSLEVLVIYFGGFVKFLKGIQKKHVIDPMKYFRGESEIRREINVSKLQCPVIVVDPTFKYRNVTAGLGYETFGKFVKVAKDFLKNPSWEFFKRSEIDLGELESFASKKKAKLIRVDLETDRQEGDIAGTKMKKLFDFFSVELTRKRQKVLRREFDYGGFGQNAVGYIVVEEVGEIEVKGPRLSMREAVQKCRKLWKNSYEKKGYLWRTKKISIEKIFEGVKNVESEMGASLKIKFL